MLQRFLVLLYMKSAFTAGAAPLRPSSGDCLLLQSGVRHRAGVSAQPPRLPALPVVAAVHGGEAAAVGHRVGDDGAGWEAVSLVGADVTSSADRQGSWS